MNERQPIDALISRAAEHPVALARLAVILLEKGDQARAHDLAVQALALSPADPQVQSLAATVLSRHAPSWHFGIVRDGARNQAYEAALKRAVTPQTKVLEIGTGSGILAMMAARAGAREVVTCEMVPAIAAAAREIVALNGYSDRVRVIAKKSTDLDVEADMGGRADLYVSEIVSNTIVGEDALPMTEHAARVLLTPGAKIIPARGIVRVALGYDSLLHRKRMDEIRDRRIRSLSLQTVSLPVPIRSSGVLRGCHSRASPRISSISIFNRGGPFPAAAAKVALTSMGGRANGVAQWIALKMDERGWYENAPLVGSTSAWAVVFRPFPAARDLQPGEVVNRFWRARPPFLADLGVEVRQALLPLARRRK
ncbi:MAG: 50S ribosomal protein L11 methyltransferase [Rhizomicrobium sp.]